MFDRMVHERPYSEDTAKVIDGEVEALIIEAAHRAEAVLKINQSYLDKLKSALIEKETLDDTEVIALLKGTKLPASVKLY
jgi:cell division protease FtsH